MKQGFIDLLESNLEHAEKFDKKFDELQDSQEPDFVTVCCSDSRVLQDHMWGNQQPGHIFTCSNIGNRVFQETEEGDKVSGDMLYPVEHTETDTMIVIGHTGCGAVTATYEDLKEEEDHAPGIRHCIDLLKKRLESGYNKLPEDVERAEAINRLVEYNVDRQVDFLLEAEEIAEEVDVIGVVYDFQDIYSDTRGKIQVINVNGERNSQELTKEYDSISNRIQRLWNY